MKQEKQLSVSEFWKSVWVTRQSRGENPNFHDYEVKYFLKQYLSTYPKEELNTVLIPFCGKSVDMLWLQQNGYHVIGIELSDEATDAFFLENGLNFTKNEDKDFIIKQAKTKTGSLTILCGDILKLQPEHLQGIHLVYDRAGLNSIPLELRQSYEELLIQNLTEGTKILFGFLEFAEQEPQSGPPYFITEEELSPLRKKFDVTIHAENRSSYFYSPPIRPIENVENSKFSESESKQDSTYLASTISDELGTDKKLVGEDLDF